VIIIINDCNIFVLILQGRSFYNFII